LIKFEKKEEREGGVGKLGLNSNTNFENFQRVIDDVGKIHKQEWRLGKRKKGLCQVA
jgi:hypothetical protein